MSSFFDSLFQNPTDLTFDFLDAALDTVAGVNVPQPRVQRTVEVQMHPVFGRIKEVLTAYRNMSDYGNAQKTLRIRH